jgi:hypothetical protein
MNESIDKILPMICVLYLIVSSSFVQNGRFIVDHPSHIPFFDVISFKNLLG